MKKILANILGILTLLPLGLVGIMALGYSQKSFLIIFAIPFCIFCIGISLSLADKVMEKMKL